MNKTDQIAAPESENGVDRRQFLGGLALAAGVTAALGGLSHDQVLKGMSVQNIRLAAATLLLMLTCIATPTATRAGVPPADTQLAALEQRIQQLEGARAVKHLQRAYGFYADRGLWQEVADLFAPDGTLEVGADGVYVGRARIREYLQRVGGVERGLPWGRLQEHYQLQPVVHVATDGLSAKGRWLDFALVGDFNKSAAWGHGIQENEYVRRDGVWMIKSLHLYTTFVAPFDKGWARAKSATDRRSDAAKAFPPDRPPTVDYPWFPAKYVVPFHYGAAAAPRQGGAAAIAAGTDPRLQQYLRQAERLQDHDDVENLQGMFGYYFDRDLWDEAAALFADDASYEHGQQGVYLGRKRIRQALRLLGPDGPRDGWLNQYFQLQPVIHVAEDGRTAKGRWEGMLQLARPGTPGAWGLGVYENEYVKERGVWKIGKLHFYVTAIADYDLMWNRGSIPLDGPSAVLPPDKPPTEIYRSLPGVYLPPFHYNHPVTGKPIRTDPQPTDSLLRPKEAVK